MRGTRITSGHNDRMLWHRLGLALGAGATLPALLIVWYWPGQHSPPSMGPAIVLERPFPQAPLPSSEARPGRPAGPPPAAPRPSAAPPCPEGREVAALPPQETGDDDFRDDLTDLEERDESVCLRGDDDDERDD